MDDGAKLERIGPALLTIQSLDELRNLVNGSDNA
jgi:hypothetical protein